MKGSHKQFARYLYSEYNDESLEPTDSSIMNKLISTQHNNSQYKSTPEKSIVHGSSQESTKIDYPGEKIPLRLYMLRDFAKCLNQDVQDCVTHFTRLSVVEDPVLIDAFKDFYQKFQTIPMLFHSHYPEEGIVYIWQINRLCPYRPRDHTLVLDTRSLDSETSPHISFLMLAKITAEEGEEIISTRLFRDTQLIVKSKLGENQFVVRLYDIKNFASIARVNPFRIEVLGNHLYTSKVVIRGHSKENSNSLEVTLWKNNRVQNGDNPEQNEALVQRKLVEGLVNPFKGQEWEFCGVYRTCNDVLALVDRGTCTVIAWRDNDLFACCLPSKYQLQSQHGGNTLFLTKHQEEPFQILLKNFPIVTIQQKRRRPEVQDMINKSRNEGLEKTSLTECFRGFLLSYTAYPGMIYNTSTPLTNPYFKKKNPDVSIIKEKEEDHEEESEQSLLDKIKNFKNEVQSLSHKKGLLKEIRQDIVNSKREIKKYEEDLSKTWDPKLLKKPKETSIETLELYKEVKAEKKRLEKERDIQKSRRKKGQIRQCEL